MIWVRSRVSMGTKPKKKPHPREGMRHSMVGVVVGRDSFVRY